jgi:hypothetical protein
VPIPRTAFLLPPNIANDTDAQDLVSLYDYLVERSMREVEQLGAVPVALEMLIERHLTTYIIIRYKERKGWAHEVAQKYINNLWLAFSSELNGTIRAIGPQKAAMAEVAGAIKKVLDEMPPEQAKDLQGRFTDAFEEAGL